MLCEDLADVLTQQFVFLETDQVRHFSKVRSLLHLPYKTTLELIFENVHKASFEENREKCTNFSKVTSLQHLLHKTTVQLTFENV